MPKKTTKETPKPESKKYKLEKSPEKEAFGKKLKMLRESKGYRQDELAEKLGMHVQSISRFERGLIDPVMSSLITIAKYFGVSVDWLSSYSDTAYTSENYLQIPYIGSDDQYWVVDKVFLKSLTDKENLKVFVIKNNNLFPDLQKGDTVLVSMEQTPAVDKYVLIQSGSEYIIKRVTSISIDGNTVFLASNNDTPLEVQASSIVGVVESFCRGYL